MLLKRHQRGEMPHLQWLDTLTMAEIHNRRAKVHDIDKYKVTHALYADQLTHPLCCASSLHVEVHSQFQPLLS